MDRDSIKRLGEAYDEVVQENWRDLLKGTPLGTPYSDKEREAILKGLQQNRQDTQNRRGTQRATSTGSAMTADQENARTNIPDTNAPVTDANRKKGFHTIKLNGKDVRRYWDGKGWKVDAPGMGGFAALPGGQERPDDERAQAIRSLSHGGLGKGAFTADDGTPDLGDNINSGMNNIRQWMKDNWGIGPGRTDRLGRPVADGDAANDLERPNQGRDRALEVADDKMQGGDGSTVPNPQADNTNNDNNNKPETQGGGGGLTDMQKWAKNFPKLAAKVKPGQAGYDEIQAMKNKPATQTAQTTAPKVSGYKADGSQIKTADVVKRNNAAQNVKTPASSGNAAQNLKTPNLANKMKNVKTGSQPFRGLPEETEAAMLKAMTDTLFEGLGISDEALEKAAAATLNKHKEQGYKVHSTDSMKDVIDRINKKKKGKV